MKTKRQIAIQTIQPVSASATRHASTQYRGK